MGHFVSYLFAFAAGILAYRYDWFNALGAEQARRWGWSALLAIPLFVVLVVATGALEEEANVAKLLGGWHWESLAFAFWESWLLIAMTVFVLYLFRTRFNGGGIGVQNIAANVYTVYIIHQTVLITLNIALLAVSIPTMVKFLITALLTIVICFGLSSLIRKLPMAKRVLG